MKLRYTVKIKDGHNAPEFSKGLGKGVVSSVEIEYPKVEYRDTINSSVFQMEVIEQKRKLMEQWFEVVSEVVDVKKERKEKLEKLNK